MKTPQLVILFRSLDNMEVKKFGQFLKSPYYNTTPKMLALYKYLKKTHPECPFEQTDKEQLFGQLFKREVYNIKKMNNLTAALSSILQDFLLLQQNKSGTFERDFNLFKIYSSKRLNNLSEKKLFKLQKTLNARDEHSIPHYYHQLTLNHELYFHPNTLKANVKQAESYLDKVFHNLDSFYAHVRLRLLCERNFRSKVVATTTKYKIDEISKLEQFISFKSSPLLKIYGLLYRIQSSPDKALYIDLREKVFGYIRQHNFIYRRDTLLTFLTNYQADRTKEGDVDALVEIFNVYKFGFKENIYINSVGRIEIGHFVNTSILATELGEADWLEIFIKNQQSKLRADVRENIVNLCTAYLSFAKGEYDKTISLASQVKRQFPNLALSCWTLEVRAHYKMRNSHDYLEEILRNFTAYLRRHDKLIPTDTIVANRNFIKIIRQLAQAAYNDNYTKEWLTSKLESMKNIVCKYWLTQEIKGLK